jgi:thymidylate kinase
MPKSGKTTILDIVIHFLKRNGFKISEYHGGGRYAPIDKSAIESLNLYLASLAAEFILISSTRERSQFKIFLMDRGIFDRCIFTKALLEMNKIDSDEAQSIDSYLKLPRLANKLDGIFLFITDPRLSLERESKYKLITETGRVMNDNFLKILRAASLEIFKTHQKYFSDIKLIDTEVLDGKIEICADLIAKDILAKVNE